MAGWLSLDTLSIWGFVPPGKGLVDGFSRPVTVTIQFSQSDIAVFVPGRPEPLLVERPRLAPRPGNLRRNPSPSTRPGGGRLSLQVCETGRYGLFGPTKFGVPAVSSAGPE